MKKKIGCVKCDLEGRDEHVRTKETNLGKYYSFTCTVTFIQLCTIIIIVCIIIVGNLIADIARRATKAHCVILNSGSLRSNTVHKAGDFTLKVSTIHLYSGSVS